LRNLSLARIEHEKKRVVQGPLEPIERSQFSISILEYTLKTERQRLHEMAESVDWLAGINKTADKPIFKFEKKLLAELRVVEEQMSSSKP